MIQIISKLTNGSSIMKMNNWSKFGSISTVEMFFRQIIEFYETKHKEEYDEYFEVEEIENYPKKIISE
ncbi:hypothetical protein [Pedobacter ureilyticus]|uniref:Uncharacterized protein n=1 Tax=Pedobacter ureilyticus TaxID=1393051 RepID=A0ABW9J4D6_9SPHI|nr:hypothetical protein [Pedobacter helvus]